MWDRFVPGFISSLVPAAKVYPSMTWLGPVYEMASYGDLLRLWITPDFMQPFALLALLDEARGQATHIDAARWFALNAAEGGAADLPRRMTNPYSFSETVLYFLLLDPAAAPATDPRPSFPTIFHDAPAGRVVARSDWGPNATMFDFRASWISINHQDGDGGQFELYRKGEWLTKEMSNYDNSGAGQTTPYHNTLALKNWSPNGTPQLQWYEAAEWANGSQWMLGLNAGDPTTTTSSGPSYVYASSDLTNLFNRPGSRWVTGDDATDILHASRSILWLNDDYIVVYDRATSLHSGLFKRFNLNLVTNPVVSGKVATETMPSGQQLFLQTLLPQNPSISSSETATRLSLVAGLEPTQFTLVVEDLAQPTDERFLHVLQGADPGAQMSAATHVQSMSGTVFDGAAVAGCAVYFLNDTSAQFVGTSLDVPANVHNLYVTGLAPNTAYSVGVLPSGSGAIMVSITPGGAGATTDGAGVLHYSL
jgi:hypothetical protein